MGLEILSLNMEHNINFLQVGRTIECGGCSPRFENCEVAFAGTGLKCKCICHDTKVEPSYCKGCGEKKGYNHCELAKECEHVWFGNGAYQVCQKCGESSKPEQKEIVCPDCMAHYSVGFNHICPPWMLELKRSKQVVPISLEKETNSQVRWEEEWIKNFWDNETHTKEQEIEFIQSLLSHYKATLIKEVEDVIEK